MTEGNDPDQFWVTLCVRLLHPIQIQIIESMFWIDYPLSASDLVKVFDGETYLGTIAYHMHRLKSLGAFRAAGKRDPVRGTTEKLYLLAT